MDARNHFFGVEQQAVATGQFDFHVRTFGFGDRPGAAVAHDSFASGSGHRARSPLRWRSHRARGYQHRATAASRAGIPFREHSRHALTVVRRRGRLTEFNFANST
jgi:hypothetical protein